MSKYHEMYKVVEPEWYCDHCDRHITDKSKAWSRQRRHWCCECCYQQDKHTLIYLTKEEKKFMEYVRKVIKG